MSIICKTDDAGLEASANFRSVENAPEYHSSDWGSYSVPQDLVAWANDQYFGRKWEMNHIYKVPGGLPQPFMYVEDDEAVYFEMNGAYHVAMGDGSYWRYEHGGPLEDLVADMSGSRVVLWELNAQRGGDSDATGERDHLVSMYSDYTAYIDDAPKRVR